MKPARREPARDEVIAVPDWLFEEDHAGAAQSAEALLAAPAPSVPDADDARKTRELEPVSPRARALPAWLWAAVGAAVALGVGSYFLEAAGPQQLECSAPVPLADSVVAAVRAPSSKGEALLVSAPVWLTDGATPAPVRAARKPEASAAVQKLLAQGTAAAKAGHHYSAYGAFERARALSPKNADAFYGIALAQYELGNRRLAQAAVARAITLEPGHPGATLLLGFIEQEQGKFGTSRTLYESYLTRAPGSEYASELKSVLAHLPRR